MGSLRISEHSSGGAGGDHLLTYPPLAVQVIEIGEQIGQSKPFGEGRSVIMGHISTKPVRVFKRSGDMRRVS